MLPAMGRARLEPVGSACRPASDNELLVGVGHRSTVALTRTLEIDQQIEHLATSIAERNLVMPAILALELLKPLGFLGSQAWLLVEPLFGPRGRELGRQYATLLEDREAVERLICSLEGMRGPVRR
jgi:hypothetical protein